MTLACQTSLAGFDSAINCGGAGTILPIVVWLVGIEIVLHLLGIRLATLFATTGALALGVGFALKGVVENWISGVILRVEQTIRPGDVVEIEGRWLKAKRIGMRTTDALAYKEEEVMIPNGIIAQSIRAGHLPTARQVDTT